MDAEAKVAIRAVHIEFEHIPHRGVHCLVFESLVPFRCIFGTLSSIHCLYNNSEVLYEILTSAVVCGDGDVGAVWAPDEN